MKSSTLNRHQKGLTLLELLLVIIIMATAVSVAAPTLSSLDVIKLELVSRELQRAIRFAQSEAIRTGLPYGFAIEETDTRFRLYKYDTTIDHDVYSPVDKQVFDLYFGTVEQPVRLSSKSIKFESSPLNTQNTISFAAGSGTPVSDNVGANNLLEYANIELEYNGNSTTLNISPINGRVTLQ